MVLFSGESVNKNKGYIQNEINEALNRLNKREENFSIIPVLLEECEPSQPEFQDISWIEFFESW